jgi:hypothetical protein
MFTKHDSGISLPSGKVSRELDTRQMWMCQESLYAECSALGKEDLCQVSFFAELYTLCKNFFDECPKIRPWQTSEHSTKNMFPVVVSYDPLYFFS